MPGGLDFDTSKPNIARVYDYWLGGNQNFAADREFAKKLLLQYPGIRDRVRENREFVTAAVSRAARAGIAQFLDLGSGLPTRPSVHEAARAVIPGARIAYVDNDPLVVRHAQTLLAMTPQVTATLADLTEPDAVLGDPGVRCVLDLARPVCVVLGSVLQFMPPPAAARTVAVLADQVPAGSWLAISVWRAQAEELASHGKDYIPTDYDPGTFKDFFTGLTIAEPGIAEARSWVAGTGGVPEQGAYILCGAGIKQ
jgi:O-methyltransferase involved in polyketide biosynthesis